MLEIVGETLRAGAVIANAYRLERVVGEGGMAVVWQAVEIATGRRVALKFMQEKRLADSRNQARVLREARATMAIAHPNVAKVFAVLETDSGAPVLVMELLEGQTLRAFLRRPTPLAPVECARILLPVVSAVQAAHDRRIVHRDLKPENIFLSKNPPHEVRVLDFGIAKHFSPADASTAASSSSPGPSLTSTGSMIGTPVYMAPEQMFGDEDIDGRADIWSLGIILYECLTLRRPTDGEGFGQILRRITTDPIVPLDRVRPGLPNRLVKMVGAMLTRDRAARPTLAEIASVLTSLETRDPSAPPSERAPETTRMAPPAATFTPATYSPASYAPTRPEAPRPLNARKTQKSSVVPFVLASGALLVLGVGAAGVAVSQGWIFAKETAAPAASGQQGAAASASGSPLVPQPTGQIAAAGDATNLVSAAMQAWKARDGKACLHDLDQYDLAPSRGAFPPSTDPKGPLATRGMCTMLIGDCENGKSLYRKSIVQGNVSMGVDVLDVDKIESTVDMAAGQYCEGPNLTEREKFYAAIGRMDGIGGNMRQGTPAMCKESYETALRMLPGIVAKHVRDDAISYTPDTIHGRAATCFAHVGDCKSSLEAYRHEFPPLSDPAAQAGREKDMFRAYDMIMAGTPCVGKR